MKTYQEFISEAKKCPDGKYWCFTDKKCKKIPLGWYVGRGGYLEKDDEDKKNENGDSDSNGSGDGGGVSEGNDFLHQGNPNPQMRNMPMGQRNVDKLANAYRPHIKNQLTHGLHSLHKARESAKNTKIMKSPSVRVAEGWSEKYKESIDCDNPKGFSQRAHCQGRKKKKLGEEFKQMPGKLMNQQMLKLQKSQSDLRKGRQTKKKRDREVKYDVQMKSIQLAGKQDYNRGGESYGKFWEDPLKTGKIRNHRFR